MTTSLELLIARLERIARANDDYFTYEIFITPNDIGFYYSVGVISQNKETTFTRRGAYTLPDAVVETENSIETACDYHGYKNVE